MIDLSKYPDIAPLAEKAGKALADVGLGGERAALYPHHHRTGEAARRGAKPKEETMTEQVPINVSDLHADRNEAVNLAAATQVTATNSAIRETDTGGGQVNPSKIPSTWMTKTQAASRLGVDLKTIYRWGKAGRLDVRDVRGLGYRDFKMLVSAESVARLEQERDRRLSLSWRQTEIRMGWVSEGE
jgi:hypothetical protein